MKTILRINATNSDETVIIIERGRSRREYREPTDYRKSQNLLPRIEKAFQTEKIALFDLTAIEVVVGQGSFTGIRVGVSVANTFAWILGIPVNGQKQVIPTYEQSKFDQ